MTIIQKISIKDIKLQVQQKYGFKNAPSSYKNITQHRKRLPVENEEIEVIGTWPAISRKFHRLAESYIFHKHSSEVIGKKDVI